MNQAQHSPHQQMSNEEFLSHLLQLSKQMAENRALDPLLKLVMKEMLTLVGAEQGYVVIRHANDELEVKLSYKQGEVAPRELDQVSKSILGYVFANKESILVGNALLDPRFNHASSVINLQLRSVMCVPLITKRQLVGAIYVENRSSSGIFSERELDIFSFFSHHAAVAIENAELNDNLENVVQERTKQLFHAKEVAEHANQAKTDFLAYVSHELRSPLASILNFSQMLLKGYYGEANNRQKRAINYVIKGVDHILSLVNDLLDLNKIEANSLNIELGSVNLKQIFDEIVPNIEGLLHEKSVTLDINFEEMLPLIKADRKRIYQVFTNLLTNAAKFTNEGHIKVNATQLDSYIEVVVEDTGIGIPKDEHELIFQAYRQSRNNPQNLTGSGLGLPITKKLVELHDGTISLESELGQGTKFYVKLATDLSSPHYVDE